MGETTTTNLHAALDYARRGWAVFPCRPKGKEPLTPHGCRDATTDPQTIAGWWRRWPDANVAIATGPVSGLLVLDIDGAEGEESLAALAGEYGPLPATPEVLTPGGGRHIYFHHPYGDPVRCAVRLGAWAGLDLRAAGGYVVAPPSVHPTGRPYVWEVSSDPDTTPLAEPPAWLLALAAERAKADGNGHRTEPLPEVIGEGQRNATLTSIGGSLRRRGASEAATLAALRAINEAQCRPPLPAEEVERIAQSLCRYEPEPSAPRLARRGEGAEVTQTTAPVVVSLADVAPERVRWLWPGRIPLGKLTILDGDPGLGKSLITLDLAARVSRGAAMPDGTASEVQGPAGVVLLSVEDDPADTIRPRLDAAGADCERIVLLQGVEEVTTVGETTKRTVRLPTLGDVDAIAEAIRLVGAKLVVVDPVMAFTGGADTHVDAEVRGVLSRLARLAQETGVAIVAVRHLNKAGGGNPLYRGGGSIGFIASARAGLLVAPDPDDPEGERRVLAATKANLAELPASLAYTVEAPDGVARLRWLGHSEQTAKSLLATPTDGDEKTALDEAKDFLRVLLADGPVEVKEVKAEARDAGISERTLARAKAQLCVEAVKVGFGEHGKWQWLLPKQAGEQPKDAKNP